MRIDSHHHLWRYSPQEYDWIEDNMSSLRRDFPVSDLECEAAAADVSATVVVQARQSLQETMWLLDIAGENQLIRGVVGWAPIASPHFLRELDVLQAQPLLKGLRHVVQGEPKEFLDSEAFNAGMTALESTGLVYDLLIFAHQLDEAVRFVDRHPRQQFVLDHIAKPAIAAGGYEGWSKAIGELALRQNVVCKISGMVTEAAWETWTPDGLRPYFDRILDVFGPARMMVGTDWPVLTVACSYSHWWNVTERWIGSLSSSEASLVQGEVAAKIYHLSFPMKTNKETI